MSFFVQKEKGWNPSAAAEIHLPHRKPAESNFHPAGFFIIPLFHTPFLRCNTPLPYILPVPLPLSADRSILPANSHMFRQ